MTRESNISVVTLERARTMPSVVLGVLCLGIFVAALDQTVVYGALADMMVDIHLPITQLDQAAWIVLAYLLGYTFAMPLMGKLSDKIGHGRLYAISILVFMAGSVVIAMSSSLEWVIGARVIQAIGGGAIVPIAMAIVADIFPSGRRAIALGVIGAAVEAGGALGPAYGGAMAHWLDWRWIFWINVPVGVLVIAILALMVRSNQTRKTSIDFGGAFLLAAALVSLSLGLSGVLTLVLVPISVALFVCFVFVERRMAEPLVGPALFKTAAVGIANSVNFLVGVALITAMVNIPLISDTIMGLEPLEGGLRLLRLTLSLAVGALLGGFLTKRLGYRLPTVVGLALSAVGFFLVSRWPVDIGEPTLTLDLIVCGLGLGLVIAPISSAVLDNVKSEERALASSLVVMMRTIGMIVGLSAITAWGMDQFHIVTAGMSLQEIVESPAKLTPPAMSMFANFFMAAAIACLVAVVPALLLGKRPPGTKAKHVSDC